MKLALALALTAAAVAAPSADVFAQPTPSITIKTITYEEKDKYNKGELVTKICSAESYPNSAVPTLLLTTLEGSDETQTTHFGTLDNEDENCATFSVGTPQNGKVVKYSVGYFPNGNEEVKDTVSFTFLELTAIDTFDCGDDRNKKSFVRRTFRTAPAAEDCLNADATSQCYTESSDDAACITPLQESGDPPDEKDFKYCQNNIEANTLDSSTVADTNADAVVTSLSYPDSTASVVGSFGLQGPITGYAVFFCDNAPTDQPNPQVVEVSDTTSVVIDGFTQSTAAYTMCVVTADSVTPPSKITDLDVKGKLLPEDDDLKYYEFGFSPAGKHDTYKAEITSGEHEHKVNIDCSHLGDNQRCYGYLEAASGEAVEISYEDAIVTDNNPGKGGGTERRTIIVKVPQASE